MFWRLFSYTHISTVVIDTVDNLTLRVMLIRINELIKITWVVEILTTSLLFLIFKISLFTMTIMIYTTLVHIGLSSILLYAISIYCREINYMSFVFDHDTIKYKLENYTKEIQGYLLTYIVSIYMWVGYAIYTDIENIDKLRVILSTQG